MIRHNNKTGIKTETHDPITLKEVTPYQAGQSRYLSGVTCTWEDCRDHGAEHGISMDDMLQFWMGYENERLDMETSRDALRHASKRGA